ncbi:translation elongation factor P (EF-P) [Geoalkalibacter ferrihydriticus]|uniref:Elongation factor P n=2 Tax=Geoalkalibacter ferrihydriticus TaxID=392333 RepID=A0A0C2EC96_9BACT|nr:elongation factor P [Geoalkalibacter ferrihydriticus]KIH76193.1 elongation factor P [Geoalkalibacter ferrihydriticus DSM 17813]SDL27967.1 translation elongation factor P (EF-P) [Geoalkalibacter ferrihydriticus]
MYNCSDLKKGLKLMVDGEPHVIVAFDFTKPGKGQALYKCKLRNMITGSLFDRTYRSGESFEPASLEDRDMQYLYQDESGYVFMDQKNYEQVTLSAETLGDDKYFLIDNMDVKVLMFGDRAIGITLPNFVNLKITQTDPWVKGDTAAGNNKPATVETGYTLQVPSFVEEGDLIQIDTRTGSYNTRVKE